MALPNFITSTDFLQYPFLLPLNQFDGETILNEIITNKQEEVLKFGLGEIEYNKLVADYDSDLNQFTTQLYTDLIFGNYTYMVDDKNIIWTGIANMLKYYVYFSYLTENSNQNTSLGTVKAEIELSKVISFKSKAINRYRNFLSIYGSDYNGLFSSKNVGFFGYKKEYECYLSTLYNFIYNRMSEFPDWNFSQLKMLI